MKNDPKTKYRVFISYSHEDEGEVKILSEILQENGLFPISDSKLPKGHGFHDQIKKLIEHAYVFIPIISNSSNKKGWVHEEIGYALAHNIPVLPVTIEEGALPEDMLVELEAIRTDLKNGDELKKQNGKNVLERELSNDNIKNLIRTSQNESKRAKFECAYFHLERTMMLVDYSIDVRTLFPEQPKQFRQAGGLSSFHIPDSSPDGEEFKNRNLGSNERLDTLNQKLREERILFEEFAKKWGFKIIINLDLKFNESKETKKNALTIRKSRLNTLLRFFHDLHKKPSEPGMKFEVLIDEHLDKRWNLIIVGDLFLAESLAGYQGQGLKQTMFTRHAATIKKQIELFDTRFEELKNKRSGNASVEHAMAEIEYRLKEIEKDLRKLKPN